MADTTIQRLAILVKAYGTEGDFATLNALLAGLSDAAWALQSCNERGQLEVAERLDQLREVGAFREKVSLLGEWK